MKNLLSIEELTGDQIRELLALGHKLKAERGAHSLLPLSGQTWALIFSKSSTRTRVSFEVGISELGGRPMFLSTRDIQLGRGEPIKDTARVLGRMIHGAVIRTYGQDEVVDFAHYSNLPTINALTDQEHPCQILADLLTLEEKYGVGSWKDMKIAFLGDVDNNMGRSWMWAAKHLGFTLALAGPEHALPKADTLAALNYEGLICTTDAEEAVRGATIINTDTCASIALEPTYFDKTQDYPTGCPDNQYLLTAQNCSATLDSEGKVQLVTEDIRNGNGRAIKSKLWSPNRVDKIDSPVNSIFWIMKDPTIPPVVKLKGSALASVMGATLATKRSSAERLAEGVDPNALVVVPYANPFRTYPLVNDYEKFKKLVEEKDVDCYIINTGDFMGKKVQPKDTLGILETIVEGKADFKQWGPFEDIEIMDWEGFIPDLNDAEYKAQLKARMQDRVNAVEKFGTDKGGYDKLPDEAVAALKKLVESL